MSEAVAKRDWYIAHNKMSNSSPYITVLDTCTISSEQTYSALYIKEDESFSDDYMLKIENKAVLTTTGWSYLEAKTSSENLIKVCDGGEFKASQYTSMTGKICLETSAAHFYLLDRTLNKQAVIVPMYTISEGTVVCYGCISLDAVTVVDLPDMYELYINESKVTVRYKQDEGDAVYVSSSGDDSNTGLGSANPILTLNHAVELCQTNNLETIKLLDTITLSSDLTLDQGYTIDADSKLTEIQVSAGATLTINNAKIKRAISVVGGTVIIDGDDAIVSTNSDIAIKIDSTSTSKVKLMNGTIKGTSKGISNDNIVTGLEVSGGKIMASDGYPIENTGVMLLNGQADIDGVISLIPNASDFQKGYIQLGDTSLGTSSYSLLINPGSLQSLPTAGVVRGTDAVPAKINNGSSGNFIFTNTDEYDALPKESGNNIILDYLQTSSGITGAYWNGTSGDDTNSGTDKYHAVKTLERAYEVLEENDFESTNIYLCGTVNIRGKMTFSLASASQPVNIVIHPCMVGKDAFLIDYNVGSESDEVLFDHLSFVGSPQLNCLIESYASSDLSITIKNSSFSHVKSESSMVRVVNDYYVTIESNTFKNCSSKDNSIIGVANNVTDNGEFIIKDNLIQNCEARYGFSFGARNKAKKVTFEENSFDQNVCTDGMAYFGYGTFTISGCSFTANQSPSFVIEAVECSIDVNGCNFLNNQLNGSGENSLIMLRRCPNIVIEDSIFDNNEVVNTGLYWISAVIHFDGPTSVINFKNIKIRNNYLSMGAQGGGVIYGELNDSSATESMTIDKDCVISGNTLIGDANIVSTYTPDSSNTTCIFDGTIKDNHVKYVFKDYTTVIMNKNAIIDGNDKAVVFRKTSVVLNGSTISNNGAGAQLIENFTMNDGDISNNDGAFLCNHVVINGGRIHHNQGEYLFYGDSWKYSSSSFEMNGGCIEDNIAGDQYKKTYKDTIYAVNFTMRGGTIQNNGVETRIPGNVGYNYVGSSVYCTTGYLYGGYIGESKNASRTITGVSNLYFYGNNVTIDGPVYTPKVHVMRTFTHKNKTYDLNYDEMESTEGIPNEQIIGDGLVSNLSNYRGYFNYSLSDACVWMLKSRNTLILSRAVFVDGVSGSDSQNGMTKETAFASVQTAIYRIYKRIGYENDAGSTYYNVPKTIFVLGTVTISNEQTWAVKSTINGGQPYSVNRYVGSSVNGTTYDPCAGDMIKVTEEGSLTLDSVSVVGNYGLSDTAATGALINNEGTLSVKGTAYIGGNQYTDDAIQIIQKGTMNVEGTPEIVGETRLSDSHFITVSDATMTTYADSPIVVGYEAPTAGQKIVDYPSGATDMLDYFELSDEVGMLFRLQDDTTNHRLVLADQNVVYVDNYGGSDENTGIDADNAVQTVEKAYELLQDGGGRIIIMSTNTIDSAKTYTSQSDGITTINNGKVYFTQGAFNRTGPLFAVNDGGTLSLSDLSISGVDNYGQPLIGVYEGGKLNLGANTRLLNKSSGTGYLIYSQVDVNLTGSGIILEGTNLLDNTSVAGCTPKLVIKDTDEGIDNQYKVKVDNPTDGYVVAEYPNITGSLDKSTASKYTLDSSMSSNYYVTTDEKQIKLVKGAFSFTKTPTDQLVEQGSTFTGNFGVQDDLDISNLEVSLFNQGVEQKNFSYTVDATKNIVKFTGKAEQAGKYVLSCSLGGQKVETNFVVSTYEIQYNDGMTQFRPRNPQTETELNTQKAKMVVTSGYDEAVQVAYEDKDIFSKSSDMVINNVSSVQAGTGAVAGKTDFQFDCVETMHTDSTAVYELTLSNNSSVNSLADGSLYIEGLSLCKTSENEACIQGNVNVPMRTKIPQKVIWGEPTHIDTYYQGKNADLAVTIYDGVPTFAYGESKPVVEYKRVNYQVGDAIPVRATVTGITGSDQEDYYVTDQMVNNSYGTVAVMPKNIDISGYYEYPLTKNYDYTNKLSDANVTTLKSYYRVTGFDGDDVSLDISDVEYPDSAVGKYTYFDGFKLKGADASLYKFESKMWKTSYIYKATPTINITSKKIYDYKETREAISGTAMVGTHEVKGTFSWGDDNTSVEKSGSVPYTFTPEDTNSFDTVNSNVYFTCITGKVEFSTDGGKFIDSSITGEYASYDSWSSISDTVLVDLVGFSGDTTFSFNSFKIYTSDTTKTFDLDNGVVTINSLDGSLSNSIAAKLSAKLKITVNPRKINKKIYLWYGDTCLGELTMDITAYLSQISLSTITPVLAGEDVQTNITAQDSSQVTISDVKWSPAISEGGIYADETQYSVTMTAKIPDNQTYKIVDGKTGVNVNSRQNGIVSDLTVIDDKTATIELVFPKTKKKLTFSGGKGTSTAPYLISNEEDLLSLSATINEHIYDMSDKYFLQTNDIAMTQAMDPIGDGMNGHFEAHYLGGNYTISNLDINETNRYGLFGNAYKATISDLTVSYKQSQAVSGAGIGAAGGICGYGFMVNIDNCHVVQDKDVSFSASYSGGIAGYLDHGSINHCSVIGKISILNNAANGDSYIGGLVGNVNDLKILNSEVDQEVNVKSFGGNTNNNYMAGGILGCNQDDTTSVINCSSLANVYSDYCCGGIAGGFNDLEDGYINNCYFGGKILTNTQTENAGTICGIMRCTQTNCYTLGDCGTEVDGNLYDRNLDQTFVVTGAAINYQQTMSSTLKEQLNNWVIKENSSMYYLWKLDTTYPQIDRLINVASVLINRYGSTKVEPGENIMDGLLYQWYVIKDSNPDIGTAKDVDDTIPWTKTGDTYESGNADQDGTTSSMEIEIQGTAGDVVNISWTISSEEDYDVLYGYLDGTIISSINEVSGDKQGEYTYTLTDNQKHVLLFSYSKDISSSSGDDKATVVISKGSTKELIQGANGRIVTNANEGDNIQCDVTFVSGAVINSNVVEYIKDYPIYFTKNQGQIKDNTVSLAYDYLATKQEKAKDTIDVTMDTSEYLQPYSASMFSIRKSDSGFGGGVVTGTAITTTGSSISGEVSLEIEAVKGDVPQKAYLYYDNDCIGEIIFNATVLDRKLLQVNALTQVTGVTHGTLMANLPLPTTVGIKTQKGDETANIIWDYSKTSSGTYVPTTTTEQRFVMGGTVVLPQDILANGIGLNVTVAVTVAASPVLPTAPPTAPPTATPTAPPTAPPTATPIPSEIVNKDLDIPEIESVEMNKDVQLVIKWSEVFKADGYMVYYRKSETDSWTKLTETNASTRSCTTGTLTLGSKYWFMVRAYQTVNGTKTVSNPSDEESYTIGNIRPKITSAKARKKYINIMKLKGEQKVGKLKYVIYASKTKKGKYKKVATIKYGKTYKTKKGKWYYKVVCKPTTKKNDFMISGTKMSGFRVTAYSSSKKKGKYKVVQKKKSRSTFVLKKAIKGRKYIKFSCEANTFVKTDNVIKWSKIDSASSYNVYRTNHRTGTYVKIANVKTNQFMDKKLTKGIWLYRVSAVIGGNETEFSVRKQYNYGEKAIILKYAAAKNDSSIKMSWTKAKNQDGYVILRKKKMSDNYETLAIINNVNTTKYVLSGIPAKSKYYYCVLSYGNYDGLRNLSTRSRFLQATPGIEPAPVTKIKKLSNGNVSVKWSKLSNVDGYYVYRSTKRNGVYQKVFTAKTNTKTKVVFKKLKKKTTYYIRIYSFKKENGKIRKSKAMKTYSFRV